MDFSPEKMVWVFYIGGKRGLRFPPPLFFGGEKYKSLMTKVYFVKKTPNPVFLLGKGVWGNAPPPPPPIGKAIPANYTHVVVCACDCYLSILIKSGLVCIGCTNTTLSTLWPETSIFGTSKFPPLLYLIQSLSNAR